ncbi:hypothetical protein B7494_g771 [Chlorociboria aeruginascens]|nr:hypothetical protein B7494_g771 [Chlorociboria aeruginascens]
MDHESAELRAVSSEPREKPFDEESSSRKRPRLSSGGSRSPSVDSPQASDILTASEPPSEDRMDIELDPPHTPVRHTNEALPMEPTSSKVTLNLRTPRPLESIPSSPSSPVTPSKMHSSEEGNIARISVETESDVLSTVAAIETPSSSASVTRSPEVVLIEDDSDFSNQSPPVAIIDADEADTDPMECFPYNGEAESLVGTVRRLVQFMQYDVIDNDESFCKLRDWIDFYITHFQTNEDKWHDNYIRYKDFWNTFPDVVWALSWRRSQVGRDALSQFLHQFARLAGRFVALDVKTLAHHHSNEENDIELGARNYLLAYGHLLRKDEPSHIGRNLETHYRWAWDDDVSIMSTRFQTEGGSLQNLIRLVEGQLRLIPRIPKLIDNLTEPSRLAARILYDATVQLQEPDNEKPYLGHVRQVTQAYEYFKIMSAGLESIIEKHVTFLSPDSALAHVISLTSIFRLTLKHDRGALRKLIDDHEQDHPDIAPSQFPRIISFRWKFTILHKLITSSQMQLRVVGVTTMCQDLLNLYNNGKGNDASRNPQLLYFAEFVLQHQLIEYIVGIGSHPEIINESNNILGFLIATRTYKTQLTDTIWQTVMTSQDPRVVDAILRMVQQCLNLYDLPSLLYICKKTCSLPIEAFTSTMRDFCGILFRDLIMKGTQNGSLDAPPYDLCVRLIRESSIVGAETPAAYADIQNFAADRLRDLLPHGPSREVRNAIYLKCIDDVSMNTTTAPGSICVINALLRHNLATDLSILTAKHGLTQLVIDELETTIISDRQSSSPSIANSPASQARRELLLAIIIHEPGTISPSLGIRLWNLLVGSESRTISNRTSAWQILNNAVKKTSTNNIFISACFRDYLPTLPPDCFTLGALDFAREAVRAWLLDIRHDFVEENRQFESQALEQLWRMILTAPPNTIDAPAINILVEDYLESEVILSMPRAKARSIHLALVDRCLMQLAAAAAELRVYNEDSLKDNEEMAIIASESQIDRQEKMFARSLAVLREFLRAYQAKPQFISPKSRSPIKATPSAVEGEPLTVKYQSFDGDKHTEVKTLTLGSLNTAASLFASLQEATGFKSYKVFYRGREFDLEEIDVCKSMTDLNLNGLVLVQRREDTDILSAGNKSTLELEITKHFDELWGYLDMNEKVAQEIYYFLIKFPVYDHLLKDFDSETTQYSEIFPLGQPYKSLYAIYALREYVASKSQKGAVNETVITRAIALIVSAISHADVLDHCASQELRNSLALHLIDSLVALLRVLPDSVATHLNELLLERLLHILYEARSMTTTPNSVYLTWRSFEAILEACLHNPMLWTSFKLHLNSTTLLADLLVSDPRAVIRKSVAKQITNKCSFTSSLAQVSPVDISTAFWPMIAALISQAIQYPQQCEETLALALAMFKRLAETSIDFLNLDELVRGWGGLLLSHTCVELVGHPESVDMIVQGLTNLMYCATSFAKASQQQLSCSTLGPRLFRKHLFPRLSIDDHRSRRDYNSVPRIPLLNTVARHTLAETIYFLVKDNRTEYNAVLELLLDIVPHDTNEDPPYAHELQFQFERNKAIRSSTNYVGLRNLSNTCYLNSLFTQLYMNVSFREFMLTANVADGGASQKLLCETQKLFAFMQESFKRYVDPAALAASIRTYEETPIDVNIQMDVDEFYNLLFDRWESQILAPDAKNSFRSFYGGQLVQQVKSKECPHISERLEPFSAIQCDIKGKSSLQESLQAYVDGEIMEGDNKYKCSTCDRHVDAVKRACLKDIPDNLIFHLKRFDFNLRTLQRSKINEYFSFPRKIDMRPYKVEHLMETPDESPEDLFELVGILVHSGTAESGHYYSFIRERPSTSEKENWVEFNDDSVTPWDSTCMEGACFGGPDYRGPIDNTSMQYEKSYSAYMLFYQRSSVLAMQEQSLLQSKTPSPVRLPLDQGLSNYIVDENELLMRKHCLYDPSHAPFVLKIFQNMKHINKGKCGESHSLEKKALMVVLHHLDQVIAKTKELPDFQTFISAIRQVCQSCAECSRDFIEWFCDFPDAFRQLVLRNPDSIVRSDIASLIVLSIAKVKVEAPYAYGLGVPTNNADSGGQEPQLYQRIAETVHLYWEVFQSHCRAWPEYFGLLNNMANLGEYETAVLLEMGFLHKMLEIVTADPLLHTSSQMSRMLNIISKRIPSRPVSYESIISLLCTLLEAIDPTADVARDNTARFQGWLRGQPAGLTAAEHGVFHQHWTRGYIHILTEKLLLLNQNYTATKGIIVKLLHWPGDIDQSVYNAICHGIRKGVSTVSSASFLKAALVYCEHSETPTAISDMIPYVAKVASQLDNNDGLDFLQFFKDVIKLRSNRINVSMEDILKLSLVEVPLWAPALLSDYEPNVRSDTESFLNDLVLSHNPRGLGSSSDIIEPSELIIESAQKLGINCLDYLHDVYLRQARQPAVRATLINIHNVIELCSQFFNEGNGDELTSRFNELMSTVLPALKKCMVDEAEEEISDWEGSEEYGSSEPMDSIAELCAPTDEI